MDTIESTEFSKPGVIAIFVAHQFLHLSEIIFLDGSKILERISAFVLKLGFLLDGQKLLSKSCCIRRIHLVLFIYEILLLLHIFFGLFIDNETVIHNLFNRLRWIVY